MIHRGKQHGCSLPTARDAHYSILFRYSRIELFHSENKHDCAGSRKDGERGREARKKEASRRVPYVEYGGPIVDNQRSHIYAAPSPKVQ